jgi:hypothetical protein
MKNMMINLRALRILVISVSLVSIVFPCYDRSEPCSMKMTIRSLGICKYTDIV